MFMESAKPSSGQHLKSLLTDLLEDPEFNEGKAWKRRYFEANDILVKGGETGRSLFFIEHGILRVTLHVPLGEQQPRVQPGVNDLGEGDLFGETSLFAAQVRTASIKAVTTGCVVELDGRMLLEFLDKRPALGYAFFKFLFSLQLTRQESANRQIENLLAWGLKAHGIDKHL